MGSTEQRTLQSILQAIIDQGNATVTQVNGQITSGTGNLEVVKDLKLQELVGATANHTITLEAKAQELIQLISEQGLRIRINQPAHGFLFNPVQFDTTANKYVKATVSTGADAMAIKVTDDFFDLVSSGSYVIPQGAVDSKGAEFVIDDFYFLDATGAGLIARDEPIRYYQPLFLVYSDRGIKTASINVNPMVDKLAQIVMPDGLNGFQLEEDMRLHTEAKSVVGGINENKSRADGLELEVGQNKSDILSINENKWKISAKSVGNKDANTDLKQLWETGFYKSSSTLNKWLNLPPNCEGAFTFRVESISDGTVGQFKVITVENYYDARTWKCVHNNVTWSEWSEVFSNASCPISKSQIGWCKFANGLIVQWGNLTMYPSSDKTVYFPISFSTDYQITNSRNFSYHTPDNLNTALINKTNSACFTIYTGSTTDYPDRADEHAWIAIGW